MVCLHNEWENPHRVFAIEKVISVFNNLTVLVNKNGTIINIYGYKEVQKRWQKTKQEIQKDHKGEEIDDYINHMETSISDKVLFLDFLR